MNIRNWKKEVFTIPNLLSLLRLALLPVYVSIYSGAREARHYYWAGAILAVSCLTDGLDGLIARKYNMVSTVGKILDPLADKLTQFILILCLSENHPVLNGMLGLLLIKEAFQLTAGFLLLRRGKMLDGALPSGKACTAVLFVTLTALVLFPDMEPAAVKAIALTNCVFLLLSFAAYIGVYFHPSGRIRDLGMQ